MFSGNRQSKTILNNYRNYRKIFTKINRQKLMGST